MNNMPTNLINEMEWKISLKAPILFKTNSDEIENLNRSITKKKIRCVIIKITTKGKYRSESLLGEFTTAI